MIYEKLAAPVEVDVPVGTGTVKVTATHRGWGRTEQPWNDPPLTSYSVLATEQTDETGAVTGYTILPGTEDYCVFGQDEYAALRAPNASGKRQDQFRNTDVIDRHKAIKEIA